MVSKKIVLSFGSILLLTSCKNYPRINYWKDFFRNNFWTCWESEDASCKLVISKSVYSAYIYFSDNGVSSRFPCSFNFYHPDCLGTKNSEGQTVFNLKREIIGDNCLKLQGYRCLEGNDEVQVSYVLFRHNIDENKICLNDTICTFECIEFPDLKLDKFEHDSLSYFHNLSFENKNIQLYFLENQSFNLKHGTDEYFGNYICDYTKLQLNFDEGYFFKDYQNISFNIVE